jgi:sulfur carrier protein ThiS
MYKPRRDTVQLMYPSLTVRVVEEPTTLREFIKTLGKDTLYAYDRRVVGVLVNDRRLWDSARLKPGDRVVVFPVIVGG